MIKAVYWFTNGTVAVFDEKGNQIPRYQGEYLKVRKRVLKDAPKETEFFISSWEGRLKYPIPRHLFKGENWW